MNQLFANKHYKVLNVALKAGQQMPRHFATSDAFIIVTSGSASLNLGGEEIALKAGSHHAIPAMQVHTLQVREDFNACVVMAADAGINFVNSESGL